VFDEFDGKVAIAVDVLTAPGSWQGSQRLRSRWRIFSWAPADHWIWAVGDCFGVQAPRQWRPMSIDCQQARELDG
jgi:hypothetical protein